MSDPGHGNFTLIQLTDTHLLPDADLLYGRLDTWARTLSALSAAGHFNPDAVLITGDLADGQSNIHSRAARLFERTAERLQCPVIVLPGNHDVSDRITQFNRHRTSSGPGPGDTVHVIGGLRVIALDSDQPGSPAGRLSVAQLHWLQGELSIPFPHGTVLAMHHPPIESVLPQLAGRGLANSAELERVIAGTDVRSIVCGHYHHGASGWLGTVPVWVSPAVSYSQDLFAAADTVRGLDSCWVSVIKLMPGSFSATPVPVLAGTVVFSSNIRPAMTQALKPSLPVEPVPADRQHASTDIPGRRALRWVFLLPFLIPPFIGAMAWMALLGPMVRSTRCSKPSPVPTRR